MTRPTRADLLAATTKRLPDMIAPGLRILFCGTNPGLYSAATGHHFARPGNRYWPTLYAAGFTERTLQPCEGVQLLTLGYGMTNVVERPTAVADELTLPEIRAGGNRLRAKVKRYKPAWLAVLGVGAYRVAFASPKAVIGRQAECIGRTRIWVLPNPSGLNAHYQRDDLARLFREFREAVEAEVD